MMPLWLFIGAVGFILGFGLAVVIALRIANEPMGPKF